MKIKQKIQEVAGRLERMHHLRLLGLSENWKAMRRSLVGAIESRTKRLCEYGCDAKETQEIRSELYAWGWFLRAAEVSEADLAEMRKELEGLQSRLHRLHDLGLETPGPEDGKAMEQLDMLLHRTAQHER
jgi:hypothetical protein